MSTTASIVSSMSCRSASSSRRGCPPPNRLATTRSKNEALGTLCMVLRLPVHRRHPGTQLPAFVASAVDTFGQCFGLGARHLHLDDCRRSAAFLDQLDLVRRRERPQRLANPLLGNGVRKVCDYDFHLSILHSKR